MVTAHKNLVELLNVMPKYKIRTFSFFISRILESNTTYDWLKHFRVRICLTHSDNECYLTKNSEKKIGW